VGMAATEENEKQEFSAAGGKSRWRGILCTEGTQAERSGRPGPSC